MELDAMLQGVMDIHSCCRGMAMDIIAKTVNDGKRAELERKINNYYRHIQMTKE